MEEVVKSIVDAGKRSLDFLAFALIAVLSIFALIQKVPFLSVFGISIVLATVWVVSRYALLKLQSRERLRDLREHATIEAQKKLENHATKDEIAELFANHERIGDSDGHQ